MYLSLLKEVLSHELKIKKIRETDLENTHSPTVLKN